MREWVRHLRRYGAVLVVAVTLLAMLPSAFNHDLWTPDEPREAQIGSEMLEAGFTAMPTLAGEPFVEKPPLFPWCVAASYAVCGKSAGAARLPAVFFSTLAVLLTFLMARRVAGSVAGVSAAAILLTMTKFAGTSFFAINDTALMAFVAGGHLCFLVARDSPRRLPPLLLAGVFASLAFMTKGIIGPGLIGGPAVLALLALREWKGLRGIVPRALLACGIPVALTASAWVFALADTGGWEVVQESVINNTLARALGEAGAEFGSYGHSKPLWYYLRSFPAALLPWALAIPALLASGVVDRSWRGGRVRYLAVLVLAGVALLSLPDGKRTLYALPLLPASAAVFGVWLSRVGSRSGGRFDRLTLTVCATLLCVLGVAAGIGALALPRLIELVPKYAALATQSQALTASVGVIALALAAAAGVLAVRLWRRPVWQSVRAAAMLGVVTVALSGGVGRLMLDPVLELRTGAERIVAGIPEGRPILGLGLGETERAVLGFYSGRPVTNLAALTELKQMLASDAAPWVVIEGRRGKHLNSTWFPSRYELVDRVLVEQSKPDEFLELYRSTSEVER